MNKTVKLLAGCTEGKNAFTEVKCHSQLSLDDILMVVQHKDCIPEVKEAYIDFLAHCFIDTEMEMKEIYTSNHIWTLLDSFLVDIGAVSSATHDRQHADSALENYVCNSVINTITLFFNSPYSDQSSIIQVEQKGFNSYSDKQVFFADPSTNLHQNTAKCLPFEHMHLAHLATANQRGKLFANLGGHFEEPWHNHSE